MKKGQKVIFIGATSAQVEYGGFSDPRGVLSLQKDYVVEKVTEYDYVTEVSLQGVEKTFSSVHFAVIGELFDWNQLNSSFKERFPDVDEEVFEFFKQHLEN